MRYSFRSVSTFLLLAFAITQFSYAQSGSPVFAVAYIEVKPSLTEQARPRRSAFSPVSDMFSQSKLRCGPSGPFSGVGLQVANIFVVGSDVTDEREAPSVFFNSVDHHYFETMGIEALRGGARDRDLPLLRD